MEKSLTREQLKRELDKMRETLQQTEGCSLELRTIQKRYEKLVESAPDAMLFVDQDTKIVLTNAQAEKLFGFSEQEMIGMDLQNLIPSRFRSGHKENIQKYFANPHIRSMGSGLGIYGLRKDGSEFPADISLSPLETDGELLVITSIRDITEYKRAEQMIERNYRIQSAISSVLKFSLEMISIEEQLGRVLDLILTIPGKASQPRGAIYTVEKDSGLLVRKTFRTLPNQPAPCEKICYDPCLSEKAGPVCSNGVAECLGGKESAPADPGVHYCLPIVSSGHTLGRINVFLDEEHEKTEEEEKFLTAVADTLAAVMMRHQAEEEKNQLKAELAESEKEAALGRITASVADRIRNPLTAIGGFARRLIKKIPQEAKEKEYAEFIASEAGRLENILRNVLSLTRGPSPRREKIDLNDVVREASRLFEDLYKEGSIRIEKSFSDLPVIEGEEEQIREAIENLMVNAADAMPDGGRLTLATGTEVIDGRTYGTIRVSDTGQGIGAEDLNRIFEPFFTTRISPLRIGLGLSITRKIMEDLQGRIRVESAADTGTTFTLSFPAAEE